MLRGRTFLRNVTGKRAGAFAPVSRRYMSMDAKKPIIDVDDKAQQLQVPSSAMEVKEVRGKVYAVTAAQVIASATKYCLPLVGLMSGEPQAFFASLTMGWGIQMTYPAVHNRLVSSIGPVVAEKLSNQAMRKFFRIKKEDVISDPLGKINQYFAKSFTSVYRMPNIVVGSFMPAAVNLAFGLGTLATLSPELSMAYLSSSLFIAYGTVQGEKAKAQAQGEFMSSIYQIFGSTHQRVNSYELANTFSRVDRELSQYEEDLKDNRLARVKHLNVANMVALKQSASVAFCSLSMIGYSFYQFRQGNLQPFELSMALYLTTISMQSLREVAASYSDFRDAKSDLDEVKKFILENPEISSPANPVALPACDNHEIQFDNVSFSYGENSKVFENASFTLGRGERTVIVGLSGVGKSTIINLMLRYHDPEGSISLDGINLKELDLTELRKVFGVAPQSPLLFDGSIEENIAYGIAGLIPEDELQQRIEKAVDIVGLKPFLKNYPEGIKSNIGKDGSKLSGGLRQRLAIARMLVLNPQVYIFDEATSSLDIEAETDLIEQVVNVCDGKTSVFITHRLNTIPSINPDNILVVENGQVVESGTYDELMSRGDRFAQLMQKYRESLDTQDNRSAIEMKV